MPGVLLPALFDRVGQQNEAFPLDDHPLDADKSPVLGGKIQRARHRDLHEADDRKTRRLADGDLQSGDD